MARFSLLFFRRTWSIPRGCRLSTTLIPMVFTITDRKVPTMTFLSWGGTMPTPRLNFSLEPEGDGAFICKNSWGESFGDGGYYYVSYYDRHIGNKAIAYTRLDEIGVYDTIYQYDELGWVGQIGYRKPSAHIANIFVANSNEALEAVSFYTLGENTVTPSTWR